MQSPELVSELSGRIEQASALLQRGHAAAAVVAYRRVLACAPENVSCQAGLALALIFEKRLDEAEAVLVAAIRAAPRLGNLHAHLAHVYKHTGRLDLALESAARAVELMPDPYVKAGYADLLVSVGRYEEAWRYHDARLDGVHSRLKSLPMPLWHGENLQGRSIVVYQEEALGDAIQMLRYVPLLQEQGGSVAVHVASSLLPLVADNFPGVATADISASLPTTDYHCPMWSLPSRFKTTVANVPQPPYLANARSWAHPEEVCHGRPKIGLVWAAGPKNSSRSMTLASMLAVCEAKASAVFFSLQAGVKAREIAEYGADGLLVDLSPRLRDFADTSAAINSLDIVVSVDTSVAHLAGAMGKRCFVLLPFVADSRWMRERSDSPWYPSIRLFRQKRPGDWSEPLREVREALAALP